MAFSDPISFNPGSGAVNFPRIWSEGGTSKYRLIESDEDQYDITVSHTEGKRKRSVIRVDQKLLVNGFFDPTISNWASGSLYLVSDRPLYGIADSVQADIFTGLNTLLSASTNANLLKWLGGQS
jgi:hypothetical protein